ncbi:MAG: HAD family phosphatase [Deferribacteres bacterium]|nr:HAD family phosphatase [candidate division KSB1 bacterium]MCB9501668.1 HAD family phosphatase [Deferribacteres bacterium]
MKNFQAYLFDMDGTLLANERLKGEALARTCNLYGANASCEQYKQVMGGSWEFVRHYFCEENGITPAEEKFDAEFKEIYQELLLTTVLEPTRGATAFLADLIKQNVKLALVSSASRWMVDTILQKIFGKDAFDVIISKEDVTMHKPDPEAYLKALKRLDTAPKNALVFEDSSVGIQAGLRAGCTVVAIHHEFNIKQDLSQAAFGIHGFDELVQDRE